MKSKFIAYLLWCGCFIGLCGLHRFYTGRYLTGVIWLLTVGLFGVGQLIDLFTLGGHVDVYNLRLSGAGNVNNNNNNIVVNVQNPYPVAAPQPSVSDAAANIETRLERLASMLEKGLLTPDEYTEQKAKVLQKSNE